MKKLPFYLTLSRIVLAPLLLTVFLSDTAPVWAICTFLFIALSITDYFDGKLARKYNVVSDFGKFFDPTGDKILVLVSLVILYHFKHISPFFLLILLSRDILIGSLRSYASSQGIVLAARPLGKIKTTLQMIAIPLLMFPYGFAFFFEIGLFLLFAACVVSIISLIDYSLQLKK